MSAAVPGDCGVVPEKARRWIARSVRLGTHCLQWALSSIYRPTGKSELDAGGGRRWQRRRIRTLID